MHLSDVYMAMSVLSTKEATKARLFLKGTICQNSKLPSVEVNNQARGKAG